MASEFRFHIMTVNHWLEFETTGEVIPVEIAMVEMSLRNGIMKKFVQFIDPGEIPPGYKAEMKINAEKFHDVWLDNPELVDCYRDGKNYKPFFYHLNSQSSFEFCARSDRKNQGYSVGKTRRTICRRRTQILNGQGCGGADTPRICSVSSTVANLCRARRQSCRLQIAQMARQATRTSKAIRRGVQFPSVRPCLSVPTIGELGAFRATYENVYGCSRVASHGN